MKNYILVIGILILINNNGFSQKQENYITNDSISMNTYIDYDISVLFKGSFDIIKNNYDNDKGYFYKSFEIIRFNENNNDRKGQSLLSELSFPIPIQKLIYPQIDTSQISKTDSLLDKNYVLLSVDKEVVKLETHSSLSNPFSYYFYLSSLYIMPQKSVKELKKEIKDYIKKNPLFQISKKIEIIKIADKKVLKWRAQNGKTRLDHYVVFGTTYNYLFVSSPYGTNGVIENVILEMELLSK